MHQNRNFEKDFPSVNHYSTSFEDRRFLNSSVFWFLFTIFVGIVVNMAVFSFEEKDDPKVDAVETARFYVLDNFASFPENFEVVDNTSSLLVMDKNSGKCYRLNIERINIVNRLGSFMTGTECSLKETK